MKIVIIGGVAGGATAAARLRRLNEKAEIVLLERGEHISFANCGLPYHIGDVIPDKESLTLQTPESFRRRFSIDVRNFSEAVSIDRAAKTVTVLHHKTGEQYEESYDKLVLSMGAEPIKPPIGGMDSHKVFTLRNIPDTEKIKDYISENTPKHVTVIGGGYIGVEMAENLKHLDLGVTIVERENHLIAPLDFDMAAEVHRYIRSKGVQLICNNGVKKITEENHSLVVHLEKGILETDMVIMAVGVRPETEIAKKAGIAVNEQGSIVVEEHMLTCDKDIYAVGDAVEVTNLITKEKTFIPLAGPANKQARIAADHICGMESVYEGTLGSSILKVFDMTVATTGINEKTAQRNHYNYDKIFLSAGSHAGYYPGSSNMTIKVLFERENGKLLGAQVVGFDGVDKRCDMFATALHFGAHAKDLTQLQLCYAPPYGSAKDPVNMAGYVAENVVTGKVKNFHWHDVKDLPKDGSITLLDVRTKGETVWGSIDGFINIPLDELRENIHQLDPSKPVYIHCRSGLRSYIACCILAGNGYETYNLSGGYQLYQLVESEMVKTRI